MTRVLVDHHAGFCTGVKRAIRGAREVAAGSCRVSKSGGVREAGKERNVISYGELIHNPQVTLDLQQNGIGVKQKLKEIDKDSFVIIRAHGIPPAEERWFREQKIPYLDLTCMRVKEIHKSIEEKRKQGYTILIVGDTDHPEVRGHLGYAGASGSVISSLEDAEAFMSSGSEELMLLAQTTTSPDLFHSVIRILNNKGLSIMTLNTLCRFVLKRQEWIRKYSRIADASLIIGGKNSSNTQKLFDIASRNGASFWIQSAEELDLENMLEFRLLAVTAGASTPDESINEVIQLLSNEGAVIELC